ncbi:MAG TPA: chemotaxis protein CheW [Candidatus Limnocylindria bacterium]|nr:chemotaxis protein CheW [Candidatus Limnocylindria bacterium]
MKIASQDAGKSKRTRRSEPVILFSVAHQTFAISADSVQEIRSTDSMAGAANEIEQPLLAKVRHTIERAHRKYFVVNACTHFNLPITRPTLVLILRQLRVAVLVDKIERMAEINAVHALPRAFIGEERRWYRGLAYVEDHVIPVIEPAGFLTRKEFLALDRVTKAAESQREMEGAVQA